MQHEQVRDGRGPFKSGRMKLMLAVAGGIGMGAALTILLRPAPTVGFVGPGAEARVVDAKGGVGVRAAGDPLRAGDKVKAGADPVKLTLKQLQVTLQPSAQVTVLHGSIAARLEHGGAVVDTSTSFEQVRIATPAGELALSKARVELLATTGPGPGGVSAASLSFVRVDQGSVRLEGAGRELPLGAGEGGLLRSGRPPVRTTPAEGEPAALLATTTDAERLDSGDAKDGENDDDRLRVDGMGRVVASGRVGATPRPSQPVIVPVPVVVPVAVPVAVPVVAAAATAPSGVGVIVAAAVPVVARGEIQGVVELEGAAPAESAAPSSCEDSGGAAWAAAGAKLANVYVHISSPVSAPAPKPTAQSPAITQSGCAFLPRVLAVQVGHRVELRGEDNRAHGFRVSEGLKTLFDSGIMHGGRTRAWTPTSAGVFRLSCELHASAEGHLAVSPHPYFAVTAPDGTFRLSGVPVGRHTLRAWHERGGEQTTTVTVVEGRSVDARFTYQGERPVVATPAPPPEPAPPADDTATTVATTAPPPPTAVAPAVAARSEESACRVAVAGHSPIAQACAAGGVRRAKAVMKEIVYAAGVRGIAALTCQSCHSNDRSFDLAPFARERLGQVLSAFAWQSYAALSADPRLYRPPAPPERQGRDGRRRR